MRTVGFALLLLLGSTLLYGETRQLTPGDIAKAIAAGRQGEDWSVPARPGANVAAAAYDVSILGPLAQLVVEAHWAYQEGEPFTAADAPQSRFPIVVTCHASRTNGFLPPQVFWLKLHVPATGQVIEAVLYSGNVEKGDSGLFAEEDLESHRLNGFFAVADVPRTEFDIIAVTPYGDELTFHVDAKTAAQIR